MWEYGAKSNFINIGGEGMYLWIVLLCSLLLIPITRYAFIVGNNRMNEKKNGKNLYIMLFSMILIVLTGWRADSVGKDTVMYHQLYDIAKSTSSISDVFNLWQNRSIEKGYIFIEFLLSRIMDFHSASLIFAIIAIVPVMILIFRYSENYWFSIFVYLAFGMYTFTFAGIRQSLAMGICCLAFMFAEKQEFFKYFIAIILAASMHISALIFAPVYWLIRVKHTPRNIRLFFLGIIASFGLRSVIYKILNMFSRYSYESNDTAGGVKLYLFILGTLILSYFVSRPFFEDKILEENMQTNLNRNTSVFNMVAFCALLWPITSANAVVFRLYYYYFLFLVLFIPNFISNISDKNNKLIVGSVYLIIGGYFLQFYTLGNSQMMYRTYAFFWE